MTQEINLGDDTDGFTDRPPTINEVDTAYEQIAKSHNIRWADEVTMDGSDRIYRWNLPIGAAIITVHPHAFSSHIELWDNAEYCITEVEKQLDS